MKKVKGVNDSQNSFGYLLRYSLNLKGYDLFNGATGKPLTDDELTGLVSLCQCLVKDTNLISNNSGYLPN